VPAVTGHDLFQVNLDATTSLCQTQEKILQSKIVEHDNARMLSRHLDHSGVISVIVSEVIDDCVVIFESLQKGSVAPVIVVGKLAAYFSVRRFKAIDEERYVCLPGEIRQQFFAVVGNSGRLWIQWAEVS
jgi:hypothetical protein